MGISVTGRKSSKRIQALRNVALGAVFIAAIPAAYNYIKVFISGDPFKAMFAKASSDVDESIGIRMDGVDLRDYKGAKLVSSAHARRIDIRKDRQGVNLYDVTSGVYNGTKGRFTYNAKVAIWNLLSKQVTVNKNVDVQNKDFDLHARGLVYDDRLGVMKISGWVTGKLYKGDLEANLVRYNMDSGAAEAGPVTWKGEVDLGKQEDTDVKPRRWEVKGAHMKSLGSDSDTYIYDKATAQDGELIVVAPIVEQNRKTDVLTAKGGIEYYSAKADILADKCVIYRKEKRTVLIGHVIMFMKPKSQENDPPKIEKLPDFKPVTPEQVVAKHASKPVDKDAQKSMEDEIRSSKNLRDFPMVVVSDKVEYWYAKGNRHATITGNPQGRQTLKADEWRHLWSHEAYYDGQKETLKLVSTASKKDTLMKNSLGDAFFAVDMLVSTKENDDQMDMSEPEGAFIASDDEIPRDDKKKTDDKGSGPPPVKGKGGGKANEVI